MNPTTTEPVNVVQQTADYDQFSFLDANREVNEQHVRRIRKSFEENGNFTQAQPILVNENFQVIDGQHRLVAARELDLPVFYTIVPGIGANEAQKMNLLHRKWEPQDYLRAYVAEGRRAYLLFQKLVEQFPETSISLITIYIKGVEANGIHAQFRRGDLQLTTVTAEQAARRLTRLQQLIELSPVFKLRPLACAALKAMESEGYSHAKMLRKVEQQVADIRAYQGIKDNLRQLEQVYNHGVMTANHVRFF